MVGVVQRAMFRSASMCHLPKLLLFAQEMENAKDLTTVCAMMVIQDHAVMLHVLVETSHSMMLLCATETEYAPPVANVHAKLHSMEHCVSHVHNLV